MPRQSSKDRIARLDRRRHALVAWHVYQEAGFGGSLRMKIFEKIPKNIDRNLIESITCVKLCDAKHYANLVCIRHKNSCFGRRVMYSAGSIFDQ
jgi:hypothetical protein